MDAEKTQNFVEEKFTNSVVPTLVEYIKIPNLSPSYDPDWDSNGTPEKACELIVNWINAQGLKNAKLEVFKEPGKTHVILVQIDGTDNNDHTVLFYGHFDKQPPSEGWWEGYGATTPVLTENNTKLYGRGAADDGYAVFSAVTAVKAVQEQGVPHSRIVILIEAGEESGSPDLPYYLDKFKNDVLKEVELVVTLDSGCATYDQLWLTSSLRGVLIGNLRVKILNEGVHSGDASGVVPSSFRIARQLLDRIENSETGVLIDYLSVEIPEERIKETRDAAAVVGDECWKQFPFVEGAKPLQTDDLAELMLNRTWRPTLSITGAAGLPDVSVAGNVLRPQTELKLSIRLPPTLNPLDVLPKLKETLESNPPYGAQVDFITDGHFGAGWNAPIVSDWLKTSLEKGSQEYFGSGYKTFGEGGSIPLMGVLHDTFPNAQFVITGVLGPASNAHGPNEFLHIPCCKKLTCCMAHVVEDHYKHTHK